MLDNTTVTRSGDDKAQTTRDHMESLEYLDSDHDKVVKAFAPGHNKAIKPMVSDHARFQLVVVITGDWMNLLHQAIDFNWLHRIVDDQVIG